MIHTSLLVLINCLLFIVSTLSVTYADDQACTQQINQINQIKDRLQTQVQQCRQQSQKFKMQSQQRLSIIKDLKVLLGESRLRVNHIQNVPSRMQLPKKKAKYLEHAEASVQKKSLRAHLDHKVSIFAFWATWCKPCVSAEEQSYLRQLNERLKPYHIPLISVAVDHWKKVKRNASKWYYPLWYFKDLHFESVPKKVMQKVGLGLPLFIVRNADGSVEWIHTRVLDQAVVDELVTVAIRSKLLRP